MLVGEIDMTEREINAQIASMDAQIAAMQDEVYDDNVSGWTDLQRQIDECAATIDACNFLAKCQRETAQ